LGLAAGSTAATCCVENYHRHLAGNLLLLDVICWNALAEKSSFLSLWRSFQNESSSVERYRSATPVLGATAAPQLA
jgi:hypothetical protein